MAKRTHGGRSEGRSEGSSVRLSVTVTVDTWRRLRALAVADDTDVNSILAGLAARAVQGVRLPSKSGDSTESAA
jgi:hypothetical protein